MKSTTFSTEKQVAITAVRRACGLTSSVFNKLVHSETLTKSDDTLVTGHISVGDYAAQAVINTILSHAFPDDPIVGEEHSGSIRGDDSAPLRAKIAELANAALSSDMAPGDDMKWGIGPSGQARTADELLDAIDRGNYAGGRQGRMWVLDPIDGTEGFLCGGQYAVCLALIVDAKVEVGVIGCPNLPVDYSDPDGPRGRLFVAVGGQGAEEFTLAGEDPKSLSISSSPPPNALNLIQSVVGDPPHWTEALYTRISSLLKLTKSPVRMHSQARYCALARGDGGAYVKMPSRSGWEMSIWDHAPGILLVQEAGGIVTNVRGELLDFGLGRTLGVNVGMIATGADVHAKVLEAVRLALSEVKQD